MTKRKTKREPKVNVILLHGVLCFLWANFLFFPKKVISLANIPGWDMHDWSLSVRLFLKNGIWKEAKSKRYLYAGRDHPDPFSVLNYKAAPTNFLIVPTAAVLLSPVYFSLKIWKASGLARKSSGAELVSQMPHYWSRLQGCLVVYVLHSNNLFCSNPLALKMILEHRAVLSLNRSPCWVTGTSWFNQHHNFPIISGQALFGQYQKV